MQSTHYALPRLPRSSDESSPKGKQGPLLGDQAPVAPPPHSHSRPGAYNSDPIIEWGLWADSPNGHTPSGIETTPYPCPSLDPATSHALHPLDAAPGMEDNISESPAYGSEPWDHPLMLPHHEDTGLWPRSASTIAYPLDLRRNCGTPDFGLLGTAPLLQGGAEPPGPPSVAGISPSAHSPDDASQRTHRLVSTPSPSSPFPHAPPAWYGGDDEDSYDMLGLGSHSMPSYPNRRLKVIENAERLSRNRKAAAKSRAKSNASAKQLKNEEYEAGVLNQELNKRHQYLQTEVRYLREALLHHMHCDCVLIQNYVTATMCQGQGRLRLPLTDSSAETTSSSQTPGHQSALFESSPSHDT